MPAFGVRRPADDVTAGMFHCPGCGGDRAYRLRYPRARFHLFRPVPFLSPPHISRRRGAPLVECRSCDHRFPPGVLDVPTSARLAELLWRGTRTAAAYVLTGVLASARRWSAAQGRQALVVLHRILGPDYGPDLLTADLAAHREGSDLDVLRELGAQLSELGREGLLRGLADLVLVLDRSGSPDWSRVGDVASALRVPPTRLRCIVDEASARARE